MGDEFRCRLGTKSIAMLEVYFDESGIHRGSSNLVVAGVVATSKNWIKFEKRWSRILRDFDINVFHASALESSKEEFKGWDRNKIIALQKRLIETMKSRVELYVSHGVKIQEFERIKKKFSHIDISPYQLCCEQCVTAISKWAKEAPDRKPFALFFEQGNKAMSETMELYNEVPTSRWLRDKWGISKIAYADKYDTVPLQAADMLAYEFYKFHDNSIKRPDIPLRKSIKEIMTNKPVIGIMNNEKTIENWLKLISKNRGHILQNVSV
jgi:hypothetical protein